MLRSVKLSLRQEILRRASECSIYAGAYSHCIHEIHEVMHASRNPELMSAFAIEMKAKRNALGISQEELAHRAEVDRSFVARIETAQNQPTLSVLFRLCEGLDVAPEEMIRQTRLRLARGRVSATRTK